ncbi:MAG: hypothetical protein U1F11_03165 [Steroidobacteraceae bacterium]
MLQVDATSGAVRELATVTPPLDNLAVGPDGTIYVSRPSDNGIVAIDPASGAQRSVVQGRLAAPGGLAFARHDGRARLWIADAMGWREADVASGAVTLRPFDLLANGSSAIALTTRTIVLGYVRRATVAVLERDSGRVLRTLPGLRQPMGVVALEDGTIYVVDYASGELHAVPRPALARRPQRGRSRRRRPRRPRRPAASGPWSRATWPVRSASRSTRAAGCWSRRRPRVASCASTLATGVAPCSRGTSSSPKASRCCATAASPWPRSVRSGSRSCPRAADAPR